MTSVQVTDSFGNVKSIEPNESAGTKIISVKTREEFLKDYIVALEIELVKTRIPKGHCPFRYQTVSKLKWQEIDCHNIDCKACEMAFYENLKEDIIEKVSKL